MRKRNRAWEIFQAAATLSRVCDEIKDCRDCPMGDSEGCCWIPTHEGAPKDWQGLLLLSWADFTCRQVPGVNGFADMERIMAGKSRKEAKAALYDAAAKAMEKETKE